MARRWSQGSSSRGDVAGAHGDLANAGDSLYTLWCKWCESTEVLGAPFLSSSPMQPLDIMTTSRRRPWLDRRTLGEPVYVEARKNLQAAANCTKAVRNSSR